MLASIEVKDGSHFLPAQLWVPSSFKSDDVLGVVTRRPLLHCTQTVKYLPHGEVGSVIPRVAGIGELGCVGSILWVWKEGVRKQLLSRTTDFPVADSPYHYRPVLREKTVLICISLTQSQLVGMTLLEAGEQRHVRQQTQGWALSQCRMSP